MDFKPESMNGCRAIGNCCSIPQCKSCVVSSSERQFVFCPTPYEVCALRFMTLHVHRLAEISLLINIVQW